MIADTHVTMHILALIMHIVLSFVHQFMRIYLLFMLLSALVGIWQWSKYFPRRCDENDAHVTDTHVTKYS